MFLIKFVEKSISIIFWQIHTRYYIIFIKHKWNMFLQIHTRNLALQDKTMVLTCHCSIRCIPPPTLILVGRPGHHALIMYALALRAFNKLSFLFALFYSVQFLSDQFSLTTIHTSMCVTTSELENQKWDERGYKEGLQIDRKHVFFSFLFPFGTAKQLTAGREQLLVSRSTTY